METIPAQTPGQTAYSPLPARKRVILHVWGVTVADQEHAIYRAGQSESRNSWDFIETKRLTGTTCPIDTRTPGPGSIALDSGYHWAYAIYLADAR
ncbi:hypothetical protein KGA66_26665 [Actinocrinis puniceicyclus]|uniref:Uncharacterized protein n=1 Tax=Actinocrinis puniceicyclus TaxID=977794 RepID=A0A8J7WSA6_9ACTN|nr:hypothetical protein [Actinocrinis puniceicyclus]MBS2966648.1 hypothetical protein [Actinocrinis puniceicyclus]